MSDNDTPKPGEVWEFAAIGSTTWARQTIGPDGAYPKCNRRRVRPSANPTNPIVTLTLTPDQVGQAMQYYVNNVMQGQPKVCNVVWFDTRSDGSRIEETWSGVDVHVELNLTKKKVYRGENE